MRQLIIIGFVFLAFFSYGALAEKEGYYVTMNGDTVAGILKVRIDHQGELYLDRIQYRIFFVDSTQGLIPLKPNDISRFSFFHKYEWLTFVSLKSKKGFRLFFRAISEGPGVRLYASYQSVLDNRTDYANLSFYLLNYPPSSEQDAFFLVKSDGTSLKYSKYSGRRNIARFFSDYPELYRKIRRGSYGYTAVYKMVREYNAWYEEAGKEVAGLSLRQ